MHSLSQSYSLFDLRLVLLSLLLTIVPTPVQAQESLPLPSEEFFYFNPDGRGAHAFQTPTSMIIEGGLSAFSKLSFHEFRYARGAESLWSSLKNPIRAVNDYGWKRFLYSEFIPNPGLDTGQWVPNWTWHLVGNGFRTRQLTEYFIHHGAQHPRVNAWLVAYSSHLLNEYVQAERYKDGSVDSIADLFFFDWVGKIIFDFDVVNRFSRDVLHLTDWTTQSIWNPLTNSMINVGQLYWFRVHLWGPLSMGAITGELTNTVNATYEWNDGEQFTLGIGIKPRAIVLDKKDDAVADGIHLTLGAYYSINDNPVFTATVETNAIVDFGANVTTSDFDEELAFVLNVYPGWYDFLGSDLGFTLAVQKNNLWLGLSYGAFPLGLAISSHLIPQAQL